MNDDVRDPLIAELLGEDEQQRKQGPDSIILPDDESVPEPYRGKPLSAALADVARIQAERDELAKAIETLKEAQSAAAPKPEPVSPPQSTELNYETIINELATQKVNQRLTENPALQPYAKEALAMLMTLPANSRINDTTIDSVITYIRGYHFDEIVGKLSPSPPVTSDANVGAPRESQEPGVKLSGSQIANLRAYYGNDTEALKNFINSLKGGTL